MAKGAKPKGGKKKGGKKAKRGGYYDVFDAAQEKLQEKIDGGVKDVSHLLQQEAVQDEPEDVVSEEEDYVSPYNRLLQTFKVQDGEKEKKKALKKRKLNASEQAASEDSVAAPSAAKKAKTVEASRGFGQVEEENEDEDDLTPEEIERRVQKKRLEALKADMSPDFDESKAGKETDDDVNEKGLASSGVEEMELNDPYMVHFDPVLTPKDISDISAKKKTFKEIGVIDFVGRIAADNATAIPPHRMEANYNIKNRLITRWNALYDEVLDISSKRARKRQRRKQRTNPDASNIFNITVNEQQDALLSIISDYHDLIFTDRDHENATSIMSMYALHAVNHVFKTRDAILKNNSLLNAAAKEKKKDAEEKEYRDQGFTRPKVLVLLPFRNSALEFVELLLKIVPKGLSERVANKKKFFAEFFDETYVPVSQKPIDWLSNFRGNIDDSFRVGISFTQKYVKLYSEFYSSDILVASPLGLRLAIEDQQGGNYDFLSSVDVVIVDQTDVLMMQNWEHLQYVFQRLNQLPKKPHGVDFSRIRNWYLNDHAKYYRQTLVFSNFMHVDINSLFNRNCFNVRGRFKITRDTESTEGTMGTVAKQVRHVFSRIDCESFADLDEVRLNHLGDSVYNHIKGLGKGTLMFVPTYFDFVRVKNLLKKKSSEDETTHAYISEYTSKPQVTKFRNEFSTGEIDILVYSERFHFYNRYKIKGIKNIVFFAPPHYAHYYSELANLMSEDGTVLVFFTKFDIYQLEPLVGSKRAQRLLAADKATHLFA